MYSVIERRKYHWPLGRADVCVRAVLLAACLVMCLPASSEAQKIRKDVLLLLSYDITDSWSRSLLNGVETLQEMVPGVVLHVEHLDSRRRREPGYQELYATFLTNKYAPEELDLAIAADNAAFSFLINIRPTFKPDLPVVFCGVNNYQPGLGGEAGNITGVNEQIDVLGTVHLAVQLFPDAPALAAVVGTERIGRINLRILEMVLPIIEERIPVTLLVDMTRENVAETLAGLPEDAVVLRMDNLREADGSDLSLQESIQLIIAAAQGPVFTLWDFDMGTGVVGGVVVNGQAQGQAAAELAEQVLGGEQAGNVPVRMDSPNVPMLDYAALQRFGVSPAEAPEDAVILNNPPSLLHEYKEYIYVVIVLLGGMTVSIIVLSSALAARRKAESSLARSEKKLRDLYENAPVGVYQSSREGRYLFANACLARMYGYESPEHLLREVTDIAAQVYVDPEDRRQILDALGAKGFISNWETRRKRKDGSVVWTATSMRAAKDSEGGVTHYDCFSMDITARKKAEEKRDIIFQLLDHAEHIAVFKDTQLRYVTVNNAYTRLTGHSSESVRGMTDRELFTGQSSPEQIEAYMENDRQALALPPGEALVIEEHTMAPDGAERTFLTKKFPVHDSDGNVLGAGTVTWEITERKKSEKSMQAAKEEAENANEAKSRFLANMSHEVRTPVNGLMGMLQLLEETHMSDEQEEYVGYALASCHRLNRLLSDILDISRLEIGRMEMRNERFSFPDCMEAVKQLFQPAGAQKQLEMQFYSDPAIPENLMGDPVRVQQILNNVAGNAVKFTEKGNITVEAHLLPSLRKGEKRVLFSVADTGAGIDDADLDKLFEPFTQAEDSFKRRHQGAGLGLSIAKSLVEAMGGSIAVSSEKDVGTLFMFCLPFTEAVAAAARTEEECCVGPLHGCRVLVAEDDSVSRLAVQRLLEKAGASVHCVVNGAEALQALQKAVYDAVLMDIQMPVMDGVEAVRIIRSSPEHASHAHIPVIALTAYAMNGDKETFLEVGMSGYLAKPVTLDALHAALSNALQC